MESSVSCPWCGNDMRLEQRVCPSCLHEVLPWHLEGIEEDGAPEPKSLSAYAGLLSAEESGDTANDSGAAHAGSLSVEEIESMTLEELLAESFDAAAAAAANARSMKRRRTGQV
ncbi:hypothetical protein [Paenibacillus sp. P22]|uniref:hypothetical protein n=1 Tax=Paenibacillus sp. P22 TaxID=483908 RepID=UPI00038FB1EF|nr:hypothetical protein [Paenibacillus sp. P22]CDN43385.1 hypothetical protein BN871_CV_00470 [Paenibacillus sp. P22]